MKRKYIKTYISIFVISLIVLLPIVIGKVSEAATTGNVSIYKIINSSDDARNIKGTTRGDIGAVTHYIGTKDGISYVHGLRFSNILIPKNATIKSAKLFFYSAGDTGSSAPKTTLKGELSPDVSTFRLVKDVPENRLTTKASTPVTFNLKEWSKQGYVSNGIDVTDIVREIVNQRNWQSGNSIALIENPSSTPDAYVSYSTYDRDPERAPELSIEFENSFTSSIIMNLQEKIKELINLYKHKNELLFSSMHNKATLMAWMYPGEPGCFAASELQDGRIIPFLKPEYFTITKEGNLSFLTTQNTSCNGFSAANLNLIKDHSDHVYVTVSATGEAVDTFFKENWTHQNQAVNELVAFASEYGIEGVELDFEGFGNWSEDTYKNYLHFVSELGKNLHALGKKLMIDVPPIGNPLEQSYYRLSYEDISELPVDYIVVMAYDYQYDYGAGKPVSPNQWVIDIIKNAQKYISNDRLVIGLPSYGYYGPTGSYSITVTNKSGLSKIIGTTRATRDPDSYEMLGINGPISYVYQDEESLNMKKRLIESLGVKYISIWSLGGNDWFSE